MGTNVCAFSRHTLDTSSGQRLLSSLQQRLGETIRVYRSDETIAYTSQWRLNMTSMSDEEASSIDHFWALDREFELYREVGGYTVNYLSIRAGLAEIDMPMSGEWTWLHNDMLHGKRDWWKHLRTSTRQMANLLGSEVALYLSDKWMIDFLWQDDDDPIGNVRSFDELVEAGRQQNLPMWDVAHEKLLGGPSPEHRCYETLFLDDFSDLDAPKIFGV